jgi:opacity protein-like surface antigen
MRSGRSFPFSILVASIVVLAIASPALAAEPAPQESKGWQFEFIPYLWGAGLSGQIGIGKLPAQGVQASFSDLWSALHMAAMGTFEVRKDKWGLLLDGLYINLNDTVPTPEEVLFGQAKVTLKEQIYTGLVNYRVHDGKRATVDMGWGARYYRIDSDLELTSGEAQGRAVAGMVNWWDWVASSRIVGHPGKNWSVTGYVDIGGAGSQLSYQALLGAGYQFNKVVSMKFGYRYLNIDYQDSKFLYDFGMGGPYLGVGFTW